MFDRKAHVGLGVALALFLLMGVSAGLGRGVAYAADGDLDTGFGGDGRVTTDYIATNDEAHAVAIQGDGKIVIVGTTYVNAALDYNFAVARYNPDGTPDNGFSGDGKLTTDFVGREDIANAVAIQDDGKILVAGSAFTPNNYYCSAVARYNPDGTLDTSFNYDGRASICYGKAYGMAIQSDGKIVLAGTSALTGNSNVRLFRFDSNGSLDLTFGSNGQVDTDFAGHEDEARGVAIQDDGKIVAAGAANMGNYNYDFALARYNPNGSPDTTFDGDGKVTTDYFGGDDGAYAMAIQPNGKIVAAGTFYSAGQGYDFGLARYNYNGSLDTGFGYSGINGFYFVPGTAEEVANGVAVQPDGKIVAAGYALCSYGGSCFLNYDLALVRLNANGLLDTTFNGDGKLITDFVGGDDRAIGVGVQTDGRIVAAGYASMGGAGTDLAVARYLSGAPPTATPTSTPTRTPTNTPLPTQTLGGPSATPPPSHTPTVAPTQTPGGPTDTPTSTPQATSCPIEFLDVSPGSTFYEYVRCLACRGIVSGYPNGTFGPNNPVTRGQLSKIVSNAAGYAENHADQSFEDVPVDSTFHQFVERLAARGHISGYPCGGAGEPCVQPTNRPYFRPGANVTRGQTSKIVASARDLPPPTPGQQTFEDVEEGSPFWQWVEALAASGAISGYACGNPEPCMPPQNRPYFRPGNNVTRGQSAKIVSSAFFPGCHTP